jgi:hypothetical protein
MTPVMLYNIIIATAVVGEVALALKLELLLFVLLYVSRRSMVTYVAASMLRRVRIVDVSCRFVRV